MGKHETLLDYSKGFWGGMLKVKSAKELGDEAVKKEAERIAEAETRRRYFATNPRCATCCFWRDAETAFQQGPDQQNGGTRPCCVEPPRVAANASSPREQAGYWPLTKCNQWCGHWQPNPDLLEEPNDEKTPEA